MSGRDELFRERRETSDFRFNSEVSEVFDDMVRRSVPFYDLAQDLMVEIVRRRVEPGSTIYDLGCATGTTLLLLANALGRPRPRLVGVDSSADMLDQARAKLGAAGHDDVELALGDLLDLDYEETGCFVLSLTLQFVRPPDRPGLLRQLHSRLRPGGLLLLVEKVIDESPGFRRLYVDIHQAFKAAHGYSELEVAQKREALENVLVPYTATENTRMLAEAGFSEVSLLFKGLNFAAWAATR
ncbi:MAG TPA: carboxy-S-adenosyl-L-methionine synthase CmoA [Thermoleophilaceae bacterium]|jgi:tRNA (cmo5U34)-methyltransferase